ncbi:DNA translocase FtsK [Helicobacter sp. MIT 05-5293]|uniref:DNA translocase FtsK n=1 Tax=Helicobacter sp. MIT 05-5293 TaxID=1548149 RepID=UPI000AFFFDC6|nr:DNA translocase FtsK [Helicobacter sp. MIT 05-5293]
MATIIGDYGVVGEFGIAFANANISIFGYFAYVYLLLLLYPAYRFYKKPSIDFRRLELIVASLLFFVALLILQALIFSKGSFGNSLVLFLKDYIGYFGVWILDILFVFISWLVATEKNIDLLKKKAQNKILVLADRLKHISIMFYRLCKHYAKVCYQKVRTLTETWFVQKRDNISGVINLETQVQEKTINAQYDFKDVFVEEVFDEVSSQMPQDTDLSHISPAPSHDSSEQTPLPTDTQTPLQTNQTQAQVDSISSQDLSTNQDKSQEHTMSSPLKIVKASKEQKLEDFLKNQLAEHRDMLENLKLQQYTALSSPALKSHTPKIITPNSRVLDEHTAQEDTQQSAQQTQVAKDMPTSKRPLNPNVFLKSTPIPHAHIEEENLKAAQNLSATFDTQKTQEKLVDSQSLPVNQENQSQLQVTQPPLYPQNPQTTQSDVSMTKPDSQSDLQSLQTQTIQAKTQVSTAASESTIKVISDSATQPQDALTPFLDIEIQEVSATPQTSNNERGDWVDTIVQEIQPQDSSQTLKNRFDYPPNKRALVTELDENAALLQNLDYGRSEKPLNFKLPSTSLLNQPNDEKNEIDESEIDRKIEDLLAKLKMFRIDGDIARTYSGPIVTTFEFRPAPSVKVSKILVLEDDLAMALRARSIRIQAPIPGKDVVGIEIPNNKTQTIYLREVLESDIFKNSTSPLSLALGKDIVGNPFITDLKRLPHLLIAGTTGSGKSVGINAMILSLLYKNSPDHLKLLMIDPKKVEFSIYADIPHLIAPIITQPKKAITSLNSVVIEMERRYDLISEMRTKEIDTYNRKVLAEGGEKLPYLVIIIDELADLMMTGGKEVEVSLARIAQMGRAAGIHIIVATQRPSSDVLTGLIKTNLPSRISYKVGNKIDARVILDVCGAESLLGNGDMLFTPPGIGGVIRLHAPWNTEEEVERVVNFIKNQRSAEYDANFMFDERENTLPIDSNHSSNESADLIVEAKAIILQDRKTSASYLQRRLSIGYNKAANIIEQLEREGFLSAPNTKGIREILGS